MKKLNFLALALMIGVFITYSCTKDSNTTNNCTGITATYNTTVKPILASSCAFTGCHDATSKASGYDLSSYATAKAAGLGGKLLCSIEQTGNCKKMPLDPTTGNSSKLDATFIKVISCWIDGGYQQ